MSVTLPRWFRTLAATVTLLAAGVVGQASAQTGRAQDKQAVAEAQYRARIQTAQQEQNAAFTRCGGLDLEDRFNNRTQSAYERAQEARSTQQCWSRADAAYDRAVAKAERRLRRQR